MNLSRFLIATSIALISAIAMENSIAAVTGFQPTINATLATGVASTSAAPIASLAKAGSNHPQAINSANQNLAGRPKSASPQVHDAKMMTAKLVPVPTVKKSNPSAITGRH